MSLACQKWTTVVKNGQRELCDPTHRQRSQDRGLWPWAALNAWLKCDGSLKPSSLPTSLTDCPLRNHLGRDGQAFGLQPLFQRAVQKDIHPSPRCSFTYAIGVGQTARAEPHAAGLSNKRRLRTAVGGAAWPGVLLELIGSLTCCGRGGRADAFRLARCLYHLRQCLTRFRIIIRY